MAAWLHKREPRQNRQQDTGRARDQEHAAPPPLCSDEAAHRHAEQLAHRGAHSVESQGACALGWWNNIGNQGMRRGRASCFAKTDTNPRQRKLRVILGHAAQCRQDAPTDDRDTDDPRPIPALRPPRERKTTQCVQDGKGQSGQRAQLPVGKPEFGLDRLGHDIHDLTIDKIEQIDRRQQSKRIAIARTCAVQRLGYDPLLLHA